MSELQLRMPNGSRVPFSRVPVDMVGVHERADSFTKRSIKNESKLAALYAATTMLDLTTLEGMDTPGKVRQLCSKARRPVPGAMMEQLLEKKPGLAPIPSVAAVCVYPSLVPYAKEYLAGSGIKVAAVSTAFPSGQAPLDVKLLDVKRACQLGADEIDMVIDRGAFLSGNYQKVFDEIVKVKDICGERVHLKVILETGELKTYDHVRFASDMAMEAGADFIKTSTGKVTPAATMPVTLVMLQAIADYYDRTGRMVGMKPAGGIRTSKQAIHYLCMVNETLGQPWLTPDWFRFGASVLLNDILRQIFKQVTGRYYYDKAFSTD
ncbi:MAG: deoxyribose-phosphate aldolase [Bdellovibrionota bacterium]